jgi:hypothetical protein
VQEGEERRGKKREGRVCWKSGGGQASLYLSKGWQMSDAMPDAADGEGGHGAANPDRVIHRYPRDS